MSIEIDGDAQTDAGRAAAADAERRRAAAAGDLAALLTQWRAADDTRRRTADAGSPAAAEQETAARKALRDAVRGDAADPHAAVRMRLHAVEADAAPAALADALADAFAPPPECQPAAEWKAERPEPVLRLSGRDSGAWLSVGSVGIVAGEGGVGKSGMLAGLAVDIARGRTGRRGDALGAAHARALDGILAPLGAGPVLWLGYEDPAEVTADRVRCYAAAVGDPDAAGRVHVAHMLGHGPLYGPTGAGDRPALYNARPGKLPGWWAMERLAARSQARVVIVDPALAAYCGESNAAAPVREFLTDLTVFALHAGCAVVLAAHSAKSARGGAGGRFLKAADWDPYDAGHVGGSTHWTDGVRSVLTVQRPPRDYEPEDGTARSDGDLVAAVPKSNYGPAVVLCDVRPVTADSGETVGMHRLGKWRRHAVAEKAAKRRRVGELKADNAQGEADEGEFGV